MEAGFIIVGIGFLLGYISLQIIPMFDFLFYDRKPLRDYTLDEWLFLPAEIMILLFPLLGAFLCAPFTEERKWLVRTATCSVYITLIGVIVIIVSYLS